jgi:hypothetical protein
LYSGVQYAKIQVLEETQHAHHTHHTHEDAKMKKGNPDANGTTAVQDAANSVVLILQTLESLKQSVQERGERLELDGANWADAGELKHLKNLICQADEWFNQ